MCFKRILLLFLFSLSLFSGSLAQQVSLRETSTGVEFLLDGKQVLRYQTAKAAVPSGVKEAYSKSGFIHPIQSPSGQILSRIQPEDHYHHYGIWGPWARATIGGKEVDFWNLGDEKGRVDFFRILSKKQAGGAAAGVFTAALLLIVGYSLFGKSENANISAPKVVEVVPSYNWTALISGESKAQTGEGTTFQVFVCDQNVVTSSLVVKSISTRSTNAGALSAKVLKGDARCGSDFDTIVVSGKEAQEAGSVNYFVSGKTSSGFDFRYDFSVTVLPN